MHLFFLEPQTFPMKCWLNLIDFIACYKMHNFNFNFPINLSTWWEFIRWLKGLSNRMEYNTTAIFSIYQSDW